MVKLKQRKQAAAASRQKHLLLLLSWSAVNQDTADNFLKTWLSYNKISLGYFNSLSGNRGCTSLLRNQYQYGG